MNELAGFFALATVLIVTPGPDTALTIRNTLLGGGRSGVLTAAGVAGGQTAWTVATAFGLAALLAASEPLFAAVRLVGAVYLILLGVMTLLSRRGHGGTQPGGAGAAASRLPPATALRQGFASNLANPKMAAFFPALLPQFAPESGAAFLVLLGLGLLFALMTLAWLTGYAIAVSKAGGFLRRPRIRRSFEVVTGAVLIALGLRLATTRRS